jgi:hypothetical protein
MPAGGFASLLKISMVFIDGDGDGGGRVDHGGGGALLSGDTGDDGREEHEER